MAMANHEEATPAATPAIEMPVMMPMKAAFFWLAKYRVAMKSSNLIEVPVRSGFRLWRHPLPLRSEVSPDQNASTWRATARRSRVQ